MVFMAEDTILPHMEDLLPYVLFLTSLQQREGRKLELYKPALVPDSKSRSGGPGLGPFSTKVTPENEASCGSGEHGLTNYFYVK